MVFDIELSPALDSSGQKVMFKARLTVNRSYYYSYIIIRAEHEIKNHKPVFLIMCLIVFPNVLYR